jgi:hypothetical protein
MKKLTLTVLLVGFVVTPLMGQTSAHKIAVTNKKVVGKWWSGDRKQFIEFLPNGVCSEGTLFPDGKWHIEKGKLWVWPKGNDFLCNSGALKLVGPNVLTRDYGMGGEPERYYRGLRNVPKNPAPLTVAAAQQILNQHINTRTPNNTLFTCHACSDPADKQDNDKAPLVTSYPGGLIPFLLNQGYIRSSGDQLFFAAKAKRSKYYAFDEGFAGFRFASFKNSNILASTIVDRRHVPIEYEFVPTELTEGVFGKARRVKSFASFSYENEAWSVCVGCK